LFNSNIPKVIINQQKQAIYFSRATIPYIRNKDTSEWLSHYPFNKHIGIYAYKSDILKKITNLPASSLELAESLEQNRWIENGFSIKTATTQHDNYPVDTQEDLKKLAEKLKEK
jgi:3-deoxy-manno-octulosonate cytidylyltransferase (CMP-KDO synthetase)